MCPNPIVRNVERPATQGFRGLLSKIDFLYDCETQRCFLRSAAKALLDEAATAADKLGTSSS
jgi:hypothetical protein